MPLRKENNAWNLSKRSSLTNTNIRKKIAFNLCKSLNVSILTYCPHLFPISNHIVGKLQSGYSKYLRRVVIGPYVADNEQLAYLTTMQMGNTSTLKRGLYARYLMGVFA